MMKMIEQNCLRAKWIGIEGMMGDGDLGLEGCLLRFFLVF